MPIPQPETLADVPRPDPARRLAGLRLLAISDGSFPGSADDESLDAFRGGVAELAADGVDGLQVREKHLDDDVLLRLVEAAVDAAPAGLRILVNGRADVAVAAGAAGVHLPSRGLPVAAVRRRFPSLLLGVSTHRPGEGAAARRDGADYVTFGPLHPTPSKPGWESPPGLDGLGRAASAAGLPVFALGGVGPADVPAVAEAGAHGVAGIRVFGDPAARRELVRRSAATWPSVSVGGRS